MLFGKRLIAHGTVRADGELAGFVKELLPAFLNQGLIHKELVQLGVH